MNIAIIIPSRIGSTRLPNKPLSLINHKTMIERVCIQATKTMVKDIYVACDSNKIDNIIKKHNYNSIITEPELASGTDRIYQAYKKINKKYDYIVNLQGDLPNIDPSIIDDAIKAAINNDYDITTLAYLISDKKEINDPNIVKIAIALNNKNDGGKALYFSRSPIPYSNNEGIFYHHIGIYVYKAKSLEKFVNLEQSELEKRESLEQLRALENNMNIYVKITNSRPISVDTKEDLKLVTKLITDEES